MKTTEEKVLAMVAAGTVSATEGERLLDAAKSAPHKRSWRVLFNPWGHLSSAPLWALAFAAVLACAGLALLGVRFDGALDIHLLPATGMEIAIDLGASWVLPALVFWLVSVAISRRGRPLDFLQAVGVARWAAVLSAALLWVLVPEPQTLVALAQTQPQDPRLLMVAFAVLPGAIWHIALLYKGFCHASGLFGRRAVIAFVVALCTAELLSKLMLTAF